MNVEYIYATPSDLEPITGTGCVTRTRHHKGLTYHYVEPTNPQRLPKWRVQHEIIKVLP